MRARTPETLDPAFDRDPVAVGRGDMKFRPRIHHGNADQAIFLDDILLGEARGLEQDRGRVVEHLEVARVIDDVGGIAVTPLNLHIAPMNEHCFTKLLCWNTGPGHISTATAVRPLSHWERVGVRGYAIRDRPYSLTRFAAQIDLSPWER